MSWNIKFADSVEKWLNKLTHQQLKSVAKEMRLLELSGHELKLPHSKALGKRLFELRERKFGYRLYYTFDQEQSIVLLYAGNKSSQRIDIKKAREIINNIRSSK